MLPTRRPRATIDAALTAATARRASKMAARDRREKDMLNAMRDVERYEDEIAAEGAVIERLLDERGCEGDSDGQAQQ